MRIGYFGGSFDPPHNGHLTVARAARDRFALDRVLLAPTGRQPLKPDGPVASFADRLRMTELLCADEPRLEASAIDAPRPDGQPNYTVDTLRRLHAQLASASSSVTDAGRDAALPSLTPHLFAILGADAFQAFPHWRNPEELLRLAEWIIVSRPGTSQAAFQTPFPNHGLRLHFLTDIAEPISATKLRTCLRTDEDCTQTMPMRVRAFIEMHRLYSSLAPTTKTEP